MKDEHDDYKGEDITRKIGCLVWEGNMREGGEWMKKERDCFQILVSEAEEGKKEKLEKKPVGFGILQDWVN